MENNFTNDFITKLNGIISDEDLKIVFQQLQIFVDDYDIRTKETSIILRDDIIPQCFNVYIVSKKIEGLTDESLKTYTYHLKDFFFALAKPIELITTNDVRAYLYNAKRIRNISDRTLDQVRIIINGFFEWCKNEGYIDINPCFKISNIKFEVKPRNPLSDMELEMVRDACTNYRDKALIEFLYSTACRVSEVVQLNINDIDFVNGKVIVFGKGRKYRTTYINARSEFMLKKYLSSRTDNNPALFVGLRKPYERLSKNGIESVVKKIGICSGIGRPLFPHLLRHTNGTNMVSRGAPLAEVQTLFGHSKPETTAIYAKISNENVQYNHKRLII